MAEKLSNQNNEINLLELFSSLWKGIFRFFQAIIDLCLFLFVFGIRRTHWVILFILAGLGIGYLVYTQTSRHYSSEMIAQPNGFTSIDMEQYINDIHDMCTHKNVKGISNAFNTAVCCSKCFCRFVIAF